MKILKGLVAAIGVSVLLGVNAFVWISVGEKYLTVKIQEEAMLILGQQLQELQMQNQLLQLQRQRSFNKDAFMPPKCPACPTLPSIPADEA